MSVLRLVLCNLLRRRHHTVLTVVSVAIGAFSVFLILTAGGLGYQAMNRELSSMGLNGLLVSRNLYGTEDVRLDYGEELTAIRELEGVEDASPVLVEYSKLELRGLETETLIWGLQAGPGRVLSLELLHGRMLREKDLERREPVCVVDESLAKKMYGRSNIVGKKLLLLLGGAYESYTVTGVVKSGGSVLETMLSGYVPYFVYIPYTTLTDLRGNRDFNQISVRITEGYDADEQGERIVETLNRLQGGELYRCENMVAQKENLNRLMGIASAALTAVAAISLVVAGIGILSVMLTSVQERTGEIGIKLAIGASRQRIVTEFLLEALLLSLTGGLIGVGVGEGCGLAVSGLLGLPGFSTAGGIPVLLFSVGIGVLFGAYPAYTASRLEPVQALKKYV